MQFEIKFQTDHLKKVLATVRAKVSNPYDLLSNVGEALLPANRQRHEDGVDPDGKKWKELSESTKRFGGKRRGGVLKKTGDMLASFHYDVTAGVLRLGFDGARDSKIADIHHAGTDPYMIKPSDKKALAFMGIVRKRVNHPGLAARPLVGFPDSDQRLAITIVSDQLEDLINGVR